MARQIGPVESERRRRGGDGRLFAREPLLIILALCALSLLFSHMHNETLGRKESVVEGFLKESRKSVSKKRTKGKHVPSHQKGSHGKASSKFRHLHHDNGHAKNESTRHHHRRHRDNKNPSRSDNNYRLAGLNCDAHGGPSVDIAKEMVYWEDIPSDNRFVSIYKQQHGVTQYLTFETDDAGWNNQRMAMETLVGLAILTGRTLVIPPIQRMWNLDKKIGADGKEQHNKFSFFHFFPFDAIAKEHVGFDVISMQEFLEREAMTGHLRDANSTVRFPPGNRTQWDYHDKVELNLWLRGVTLWPQWDADKCLLVFPVSKDPKDLQAILDAKTNVEKAGGFPKFNAYVIGKPVPVNASIEERMKENWAEYWKGGKTLCVYEPEKQKAPVLHFPYDWLLGARMLTHFYSFLFFQDWRQDLWMKRFIRDHVRYSDLFQCAAARIVHRLRERSRSRGDPDGNFDSFHIRREDFAAQFKDMVYDANRIYNISKGVLVENSTVYIASDERNRSFFDPMRAHYDLVFLEDFQDELTGLNTNYYGMIEQLVVSRARSFFGCWKSSFTSYINRLRGYHANKAKLPGYEQGLIPSWYYATEEHRNDMRTFYPIFQGYYEREFPTSWRLIDTGANDEMEDLLPPS